MRVKVYKCVLGHVILTTDETSAAPPEKCPTCKSISYLGDTVENYMTYIGTFRFDTEILSVSTSETPKA